MASHLSLVLGGVRSGKSAYAESLAAEQGGPVLYVATGKPEDSEMRQRILRHRQSRPARWTTLEEPLDLAGRLKGVLQGAAPPEVVLIDSLDLWVGNLLLAENGETTAEVESRILSAATGLLDLACHSPAAFFLVSSEVGSSLVPVDSLGRRFQDLMGLVNQRVATAADRVLLVVAGIPVDIKGQPG